MRPLFVVLIVQVALGTLLVGLVLSGVGPFAENDEPGDPGAQLQTALGGPGTAAAATATSPTCAGDRMPRPRRNAFNGRRAFALLEEQVRLGPRPAGSRASRRLAARLRRLLPRGRFQAVPGGLRNVVGTVPGRDPGRVVVVGAHYDTKDIPGFVGANDAAGGTAAVVELARSIRPRTLDPTFVFILFDGEESPAGTPSEDFEEGGLRGSRVAARAYRNAESMILLDFIAERELSIPREKNSDPELWSRLQAAARRVGVGCVFPDETFRPISDDHIPFIRRGIPSINLIDFDFECWHETCDDLSAVSPRSLDASGEAVRELLSRL